MTKDYSIVKIGKNQYFVKPKMQLVVEKIDKKAGAKIIFDQVLLSSKKGKILIGKPTIKGAKVEAKIIEQFKGKKIIVFKYRAKSRYRKRKGHRQQYTRIDIIKI